MAKQHSQFQCRSCGASFTRWMGKCPDCGEWNSLEEQVVHDEAADRHRPILDLAERPLIQNLAEVRPDSIRRYPSTIGEFDRVLGGGIVPGSATLIGGDPGIGKSTLLLQAANSLAASGRRVIYVTSEESIGQLRLRSERLGIIPSATNEPRPARPPRAKRPADDPGGAPPSRPTGLLAAAHANLDVIFNLLQKEKPDVVIVDSIQMVYRPDMTSSPGSAAQLRDAAARLIWLAKHLGFAIFLVGHVTKDGAIAGPKLLEHLVDCVIYFEGDRFHSHRLLRAVKNRFGSTDELGIFEMTDGGLAEVADPSKIFLQENREARPGSVILTACEGTRTLLVEVQALCAQSVFGAAKRKATGVDSGRVAMILAVIERYADCVLGDQDVFVNVVGGVRVHEPAADLAIALAVVSAMTHRTPPTGCVVCGELGLGGELRAVHHQDRRIMEAARVGFKQFILPRPGASAAQSPKQTEMQFVHCANLNEAVRCLG